MNNFYKDIKVFFKDAPGNERIISLYERGLITITEAIRELVENNDIHNFWYSLEFREKAKKGRYKPLNDTLYEYEEAAAYISGLEDHSFYEFRLKKTYKGITQTLHA